MNIGLIFVYNAKSGFFNKLTDFAHKAISPETYACQLCNLTHSHFGMLQEWQNFLTSLSVSIAFDYKDTFIEKYGFDETAFPAIFKKAGGDILLASDAPAIQSCQTMEALQQLVMKSIEPIS